MLFQAAKLTHMLFDLYLPLHIGELAAIPHMLQWKGLCLRMAINESRPYATSSSPDQVWVFFWKEISPKYFV